MGNKAHTREELLVAIKLEMMSKIGITTTEYFFTIGIVSNAIDRLENTDKPITPERYEGESAEDYMARVKQMQG